MHREPDDNVPGRRPARLAGTDRLRRGVVIGRGPRHGPEEAGSEFVQFDIVAVEAVVSGFPSDPRGRPPGGDVSEALAEFLWCARRMELEIEDRAWRAAVVADGSVCQVGVPDQEIPGAVK